jgi:hypothetical protein
MLTHEKNSWICLKKSRKESNNTSKNSPRKDLTGIKQVFSRKNMDLNCYRLKITDGSQDLNHRAIFGIKDNNFMIYKVGERPGFYDDENLRDAERRI